MSMRGQKPGGQMQPSEQNEKVHSHKTESGRTVSASIRAYKSECFDMACVCAWHCGDARRASVHPQVGSLRLSLGYKIQKSREKGPGGDAGPSPVWKKGATGRGEGCGTWAARWLSAPRAGTACWHRAGARPQAAWAARGKEVKRFKGESRQHKPKPGLLLILFPLITSVIRTLLFVLQVWCTVSALHGATCYPQISHVSIRLIQLVAKKIQGRKSPRQRDNKFSHYNIQITENLARLLAVYPKMAMTVLQQIFRNHISTPSPHLRWCFLNLFSDLLFYFFSNTLNKMIRNKWSSSTLGNSL